MTANFPRTTARVRIAPAPRRGLGLWLTGLVVLSISTVVMPMPRAASSDQPGARSAPVAVAGPIDDAIEYLEWLWRQLLNS